MNDLAPLPEIDDFERLFLQDTPLLDVRAPVEFTEGAFPCAENHPLIDDAERQEIGIRYKHLGQDAAIDLGHELVQGELKQERVAQWRHFAEQHPSGVLYCFRGGMRSKISQQWLHEASGISYPRVKGGYKALRRYLLDLLEEIPPQLEIVVLGGRTGVGKTRVLSELANVVDLEGLAHHRGSAFGPRAQPQPSQIDFENALAVALLKFRHSGHAQLVLEDESRNIGSNMLPPALVSAMQEAPLVLLEEDLRTRIELTFDEYITQALAEHQALFGEEQGLQSWSDYLSNSIDKIKKRLGGERHAEIRAFFENAISEYKMIGSHDSHRVWIGQLLTEYYDPMYDYQLSKKTERIKFRGNREQVLDYLGG